MKKRISFATIIFIGLSALISISALFRIFELKGVILDLLFTFLTLTIAGILTLGTSEMLERKNKIAIISLSLLGISTLLVVLCYWTNLDSSEAYLKTTLVTSTLSIYFNLISSNILKMGKSKKVIQGISYICYSVVALYLILIFLDAISLNGTNLKIFILFIILSFVALCVLTVLSKKSLYEDFVTKEYIKITKEEYEDLLNKKAQLENLLKEGVKND